MKNSQNTGKSLLGIALAAIMLAGSVPLGFSEPLKVQLEQGITPDQIRCDNDSHVLAQRPNGNYACVTESTAKKTGWEVIPTTAKDYEIVVESIHPEKESTVSEPTPVISHSSGPCYVVCVTLSLSDMPELGQTATMILNVTSTQDYPSEHLGDGARVFFVPTEGVEILEGEYVDISLPENEPYFVYALPEPFTINANEWKIYTTDFKVTKLGEVKIEGAVQAVSDYIYLDIDEDETTLYVAPSHSGGGALYAGLEEEMLELRTIIEKRGGIGPERFDERDTEIMMDIIRFEGILTEEEAELYMNFLIRAANPVTPEEHAMSWEEFERFALTDEIVGDFVSREKKRIDNPDVAQYKPTYREGEWENGLGVSLAEIRQYLAVGNYMTESEIEQFVQEYLSDDFLELQSFFSFEILPKAYAAGSIDFTGVVKANQSPTDTTDDRVAGIVVCVFEKDGRSYDYLHTNRNKDACDTTDENGRYVIASVVFDYTPKTIAYAIQTDYDNSADSRNLNVKLLDEDNDHYTYRTSDVRNVDSDQLHKIITLPSSTIRNAAWIVDAVESGYHHFEDGPPNLRVQHTTVHWQHNEKAKDAFTAAKDCAYACAIGDDIYLDGAVGLNPGHHKDRSTVIHEFGHVVMHSIYKSDYPRNDCPSPHLVHLPTSNRCAWIEGWATFMPHYVDDESELSRYLPFADFALVEYNLEEARVIGLQILPIDFHKTSSDGRKQGQITEGRVAAVLWDLFDNNIDNQFDRLDGIIKDSISLQDNKMTEIMVDKKPRTFTAWNEDWKKEYSDINITEIMQLHYMAFANSSPEAQSKTVTAGQGQPKDIYIYGVDEDNDPLSFEIIHFPNKGQLEPNTLTPPSRNDISAKLVYTSNSDATGTDFFAFRVYDGTDRSSTVQVTIIIKEPPQQITQVKSEQENLTSVIIRWVPPVSINPIQFFEIMRSSSPYVSIANVTSTSTSYTDDTVEVGNQYSYIIRPYIADDIAGEFSTPIQVSIPASDATSPRIDSISRLEPLDESTDSSTLKFRVTFDEPVTGVDQSDFETGGTAASSVTGFVANSAVQYDVDVSVTTGGTVSLNLISSGHGIADTDFVPNALTDTAPKSITQTYIVALDTTVPGVPTDVTATLVSTLRIAPYWPPPSDESSIFLARVVLDWTPPSHEGDSPITGYLIERSIDDKEFVTIASDSASRNFLYVDTVRDSTAVSYRVSAINDVGVSLPSEASKQTSTLPKNEPPLIQLIDGNREVDAQTLLSFSVYVIDRDRDPLTYSLGSNAPQGAEIGRTTGEFTWTPTQSQVGTHTFDAIVSDGKDTDSKTITVIVNDAKDVP